MGEYATRKSDGVRVKIGTCESLYYLRYEDAHKVDYSFAGYEWFWRLPFPDEDEVGIGEYQPFERGAMLGGFADDSTVDYPGCIQLRHDSGLLLNVPCYHGIKLPEVTEPMRVFWNGKSPSFFELAHVKNMADGTLLPVVRCRFCGKMWRYSWAEILTHVSDKILLARLEAYAMHSVSQEIAS